METRCQNNLLHASTNTTRPRATPSISCSLARRSRDRCPCAASLFRVPTPAGTRTLFEKVSALPPPPSGGAPSPPSSHFFLLISVSLALPLFTVAAVAPLPCQFHNTCQRRAVPSGFGAEQLTLASTPSPPCSLISQLSPSLPLVRLALSCILKSWVAAMRSCLSAAPL